MLAGPVTAVVKRLTWLGPATIAVSIAAVFVVQQIALLLFSPLPRENILLRSTEAEVLTAVFVSGGVLVLSFIPDIILGYSSRRAQ
jgi:hypothetical protein